MLYPLPAVAAFLLMRNYKVSPGENAGLTAVAAMTPSVLGLAPAVVAASAAGRSAAGGFFGGRRLRPMRRRFYVPTPPPEPAPAPTWVTVPGVVGESFAAAQDKLKSAGLVAGRWDVHSDAKAETVLDQDPPSGRHRDKGDMVGLTVSLGPDTSDVTEADEMSEMKTIEGKVDHLKEDVDAKLNRLHMAIETLSSRMSEAAGSGRKGGPSAT